jgi:heterodisulfide reductase subunit A-like polyferredoxin
MINLSTGYDINDRKSEMDKPKHPNVVRTWKVERIRKPATPKKRQVRPVKKSKP